MIIFIRYFYRVNMDSTKDIVLSFALLAMLENVKKPADKGNEFGALFTNLSKAFDCSYHKLLIAKLF